ncbi:hypothetical protein RIF29_22315 [Crotalaria pallida]|uniref:Uncharacterized protein n=1 Tax=Crotalaria pallida TaxID=3830 RepID=A0AAN9FD53_CROPI
MDVNKVKKGGSATQGHVQQIDEHTGLRKGPWTVDEDTILVNYINSHGEGHWNNVARCAGLSRSGKSCRLRWVNYLRPDVRRGNITLEELILILDLHSRWGNRWSKIAQYIPGRTDNEIKNYWRTRVIKQAKQLKCDVNSKQFRDILRYVWMPRLLERAHHASSLSSSTTTQSLTVQNQLDPKPSGTVVYSGTECVKQNHFTSSRVTVTSLDSSQLLDDLDHVDLVNGLENVSESWSSFNNQIAEQGNGGGDSLQSLWKDENIMWIL